MLPIAGPTLLLIPVFNEAENIAALNAEIRAALPGIEVCWINDGSSDGSDREIRATGRRWLNLPCNLGIGSALQTGFRYALDEGFEYAIRLDGDGQHPPDQCIRLAERMRRDDVDLVVGSRFLADGGYRTAWHRQAGIYALAWLLSRACRRRITDPTSGFQMANRAAMAYFAHHYPADYPEPEALALLSRQGYRCCEVPVVFRPRRAGVSSIRHWGTLFYAFKVGVALFVDRFRAVDPLFDRHNVKGRA